MVLYCDVYISGDSPSLFLALTSAPASISKDMTSEFLLPMFIANISGVQPSMSLAFTSAPASISKDMTSVFLWYFAASISGVLRRLLLALILAPAPASRSNDMTSEFLPSMFVANISGVQPSMSLALTSAPALMSAEMTSGVVSLSSTSTNNCSVGVGLSSCAIAS